MVRISFFPLKSVWCRRVHICSLAGDGSQGTRGLLRAAAADLGGLHGLVEGRGGKEQHSEWGRGQNPEGGTQNS